MCAVCTFFFSSGRASFVGGLQVWKLQKLQSTKMHCMDCIQYLFSGELRYFPSNNVVKHSKDLLADGTWQGSYVVLLPKERGIFICVAHQVFIFSISVQIYVSLPVWRKCLKKGHKHILRKADQALHTSWIMETFIRIEITAKYAVMLCF